MRRTVSFFILLICAVAIIAFADGFEGGGGGVGGTLSTLSVAGASSLDSGQITTSGSGDLTVVNLTATGLTWLDNGNFATDGNGGASFGFFASVNGLSGNATFANMTVNGTLGVGNNNLGGASLYYDGNTLNLYGGNDGIGDASQGNIAVSGDVTAATGIFGDVASGYYSPNGGFSGTGTTSLISQPIYNNTNTYTAYVTVPLGVEITTASTGTLTFTFTATGATGAYSWSTNINTGATGYVDCGVHTFVVKNGTALDVYTTKTGSAVFNFAVAAYRFQ